MRAEPPVDGIDPSFIEDAKAFAEHNRERLVQLCADLVAARSALPEGDTTGPAGVLLAFFAEHGLTAERLAAIPGKPNVVCRVAGFSSGPHLVLNGHLDTLSPGDLAGWSVPPLSLTRSGGRLSGLGIGNMKAGTAALAFALVFLSRRADAFPGAVTYAAVADEVAFGPHGAAWLLETDPTLRGDAMLNAEGPGAMGLAAAEKGLLWLEVVATAPAGQGMLTVRGSSAIVRLARTLAELDGWNEERAEPPAGMEGLAGAAGPHGLRLSVNVGTIGGGDFVSQVATTARAEVDVRVPPGLTIAAIERRIDELCRSRPDIAWRRIKGWDPNWTALDSAIVRAVAHAAERVRGRRPPPVVRLPASDASRWRLRGVPAVCFGPQPELASGVDDYVWEQDVVDCVAIYAAAALEFQNGGPD